MELEIVRADPAGNITIFVLSPVTGREARAAVVRALLADPVLKAEQVGFVIPPSGAGGLWRHLWRLEMMGGEFCGNAARSFGLLIARSTGCTGIHTLMIEISGMARPLPVRVDTVTGTAEVAMPGPLAETALEWQGRSFPAYVFEGITHVIAEDTEADAKLLPLLLDAIEAGHDTWLHPDARLQEALGILFYDTRKCFMRPLVWVRASGTTVFESSCGSGSAALGAWKLRLLRDGREQFDIAQPGGVITVCVEKRDGVIQDIAIGGKVILGEPLRFTETL